MQRTLIVAYGNPLRCDDGIGWHAADLLRKRLPQSQARILCLHQLTPEVAEAASHADTVIFIDATCHGEPGQIVVSTLPQPAVAPPCSHHSSPENLIALCRRLYGHCPRAYTVSIGGACFDHGDELSCAVTNTLAAIVGTVNDLIAACIR